MKAACPRLFEAEALRDGRLSGAEVVRFEAHLNVCPHCKREMQALNALGAALRRQGDGADELRVRRERTRLLAAFDATLMPAPRRSRYLLWPVAAAAVLALGALLLTLRPWHRQPTAPVASVRVVVPEAVRVQADGSAKWSRRTDAQRETIVLESGELSIKVEHTPSRKPLLVMLPDGELEDIGTTFSVSASDGRTTRVSVQEGSVVLRLHGEPARALGAGELWSLPVVTTPTRVVPAAPAPPSARPGITAAPAGSCALAAKPPAASSEFRSAMAALDRGDNHHAAGLFGAFVAAHPGDPRAEDATYLRVLALQRAGSSSAMQRAAAEYLRRYPQGFRKAEVEPLASDRGEGSGRETAPNGASD